MVNKGNTMSHDFKTLSIFVAFFGLLIFPGVAQAESFWLVNGAKVTTTLSPVVEIETDVPKTLLTELGGKGIHIKCLKAKLVGAHLTEPGGKGSGKLRYSECDFLSLKTLGGELILLKACEPITGAEKGVIEVNTTTASMVATGVELKPAAGEPLATVHFGEECAFGEQLKVEGALLLLDGAGQFLTDLVKHLFEYSKASKLVINGGPTTATLDGSVWAFLGGAHKGMTFAGHP
jgi:hypothetical protein